jgi:hypothetical protein
VTRALAVAVACTAISGCGGEPRSPVAPAKPAMLRPGQLYVEPWFAPTFHATLHPPRLSRASRSLVIEVQSGRCVNVRDVDAPRRLHHIAVRETRAAIYITVFMRPERQARGGLCAGVAQYFLRRVRLRSPVGRRAVIDGRHYYRRTHVVYPALHGHA